MPKVSIVVPVYNVEKYLDECLESVSNQSFPDWECILVDDGCTDKSGGICDEWAERDDRFRVIHQRNQGVSASRNNGVKAATGEWVVFVDSDDWVEKDYLKDMVDGTRLSVDAEIILSSYDVYRECDGHYEGTQPLAEEVVSLDAYGIGPAARLVDQYRLMGPVCKLYRREIIQGNDVLFPKGISYGEDLLFNLSYLRHATKIVSVPSVNYHYRRVQGSLSMRVIPNYWQLNYSQWLELVDVFKEKGMLGGEMVKVLYRRLWGIVYDSIFMSKKINTRIIDHYRYIRTILSVPEIGDDDFVNSEYGCAPWIKRLILCRMAIAMTGVVMMKS